MELKIENFFHWTPARVFENGSGLYVDWLYLGEKRFTEPFHKDTVDLLLRQPFNLLFDYQTQIEFLGELYEKSPGVAPKGFIFHVSRCGSTLASRMLAGLSKNIVISEASVIDKIIRANAPQEQRIIWLRWMINALGQRRFADEENFFIKFDCWNALDLPLIERAFPGVSWIFIYRDPVEVIASHLRQPGVQMIPGAIPNIFPQMSVREILRLSTEERFARTIEAFFRAALENAHSPNGKFINYDQLPGAMESEVFRHFGVGFSREEIATMQTASKFNAKNPTQEFSPDGERKRNEATAEAIFFAEKLINPLYEKLENLRRCRKA